MKSGQSTGYYGADGGLAPLFSFGGQPLAKSFLTGSGSHLVLWTSVLIHLAALGLTIAANVLFLTEVTDATKELYTGWSICSLSFFSIGVLGTVVATGLIKDVFSYPLLNTAGMGFFLGGFMATAKIGYLHGVSFKTDEPEVVLFNLALFFQAFAISSLLANALTAVSDKGL